MLDHTSGVGKGVEMQRISVMEETVVEPTLLLTEGSIAQDSSSGSEYSVVGAVAAGDEAKEAKVSMHNAVPRADNNDVYVSALYGAHNENTFLFGDRSTLNDGRRDSQAPQQMANPLLGAFRCVPERSSDPPTDDRRVRTMRRRPQQLGAKKQ